MGLTVKGSPMNGVQQQTAETLLGVATKEKAGAVAAEACIFDAIFESDLGADTTWNPTYGGVLGGAQVTFGSLGNSSSTAVTVAEATSFFRGGNGYQGGGAIALARTHDDVAYIGSQVTAAVPFDSNGYSTQYQRQGFAFSSAVAEAKAIVAAYGGNNLKGAVAGGSSGGTGTILDNASATTYAFSIGGSDNPDEDYWTGCNRLAQEVNWYFFTNGEYLYYLDGQEMLQQRPALYLDRIDDSDRIVSMDLVYDNTAYGWVSHRQRKFTAQRPATVVISTSPTQGTLQLTCGIDEVRGGDVIVLTSFGLADGRWIVAECRRSVFSTSSQITLVPPVAPITEAAAAGTTGKTVSAPTATPVKGVQPTGGTAGLASPFAKKYQATLGVNTDMGVDFGTQQGIAPGDPIFAIGDCYLRDIHLFYEGQPIMSFELVDKSAGYWGWYISEQINVKVSTIGGFVKRGTTVATYASSGTGIEIGWAGAAGQTATQVNHPDQVATRHDGHGTTDGNNFFHFLQSVGAV